MASKYVRAVGGNSNADATWSTTSGGAADTTVPTAADDVFLDASSGQLTINAAMACRSINCTGYTGTLTQSESVTIGDATAGASNVALKFVAGMTLTVTAGGFNFISTSATVQTIDFAGKETREVVFNATSNGSWQYTGAHVTGATRAVTLTKGTLDINGQTCSFGKLIDSGTATRVLTLGAATITLTGASANVLSFAPTGLTLSAATSSITATGATGSISPGNGTEWGSISQTGSGSPKINTALSCVNYTRTGTAVKTDSLILTSAVTCSGTFTCNGNSIVNRMLVNSDVSGTARTITAATVTVSNCDFQDITGAGAGSWDFSARTDIGDCGGNTNITFPASVSQTWNGASGGNWSTNAWTTRVPLPQDDVSLGVAFSASQTVTADMPRLGRSIDWTGATGSPTFAVNSSANTLYGSLTLISAMTLTSTVAITFAGRGNFTITSAGKTFGSTFNITAPSGVYTLQDALVTSGQIVHTYGTLNSANFNITCTIYASNGSTTRSVLLGTSTVTLTHSSGSATVWNFNTTTNLTSDVDEITIIISTVGTDITRTFAGGGLTYGTLTYTVAGSTGKLTITGSNTFNTINFSDTTNARTLEFTAGTTTTITNKFNVNGLASKLMTVTSATAATHTLSMTSGIVNCDYLAVSYSIAGGGATWYAGNDSTDSGNNTGWIFESAPVFSGGNSPSSSGLINLQNLLNL